jgi:hypothetical protein
MSFRRLASECELRAGSPQGASFGSSDPRFPTPRGTGDSAWNAIMRTAVAASSTPSGAARSSHALVVTVFVSEETWFRRSLSQLVIFLVSNPAPSASGAK